MSKKYLFSFFILIFSLCIFTNIIYFATQINTESNLQNNSYNIHFSSNQNFFWPTPGFYNITSKFGQRVSPITGKFSTHHGIDIGASEGTHIYAVQSGIVSFIGFNGANGYSIHIQNNNFTFIYGHVSPNFIVPLNDFIDIGTIIGYVGPKYVQPTPENTYKDNTGKTTNGSTTGPHLHLGIKKDGKAVNPLNYF